MDDLLRKWGQNIRRQRTLRNSEGEIRHSNAEEPMSQAELGALLDPPVTQATVSRWEEGKMEPRLAYKIQIAQVLGDDASTLFPLPATAVA
jgi:DNA-binding XRE family transcriptional regulator